MLPAHAAPKDTSSPAQVAGIIDAATDKLWAQNDAYWHQGDYPRIIALDRIITQADPHFIECYNTGAWLMWSSGRDADAQAFYAEAVANNPHDSTAYYDYGMFPAESPQRLSGGDPGVPAGYPAGQRRPSGLADARPFLREGPETGGRRCRPGKQIKARWPHGTAHDRTSADVDDNNLHRALAHLNGTAPAAGGTATP